MFLNMIMSIKQQIINIKDRTYYFFDDMINIKDSGWSLLKLDTIKKIDDYENIYSVNPLYLIIGKIIGHIDENNGNKYLKLKWKQMRWKQRSIKKYKELWDGIEYKVGTIKSANIVKIFQKLNLTPMMIFH